MNKQQKKDLTINKVITIPGKFKTQIQKKKTMQEQV